MNVSKGPADVAAASKLWLTLLSLYGIFFIFHSPIVADLSLLVLFVTLYALYLRKGAATDL